MSAEQVPVTYDSAGVLRTLVMNWDAAWVPILDVNRLPGKDKREESYWPVGLSDSELICVVCKVAGPARRAGLSGRVGGASDRDTTAWACERARRAGHQGLNTYPAIAPRPIVSNFALQVPVITSDATNVALEAGYVVDGRARKRAWPG